jgi:hypothetical protein
MHRQQYHQTNKQGSTGDNAQYPQAPAHALAFIEASISCRSPGVMQRARVTQRV